MNRDNLQQTLQVLVVDDHRMFAQSLLRILGDEPDIEVVGLATTVEEAVGVCSEHPADVVLLDYELPDSSGVSGILRLREVLPAAQFVMLTGHADGEVLSAAIEAGCCGFITKNEATDLLLDAIRAAGSGKAVISPAMLTQLLPRLRESSEVQDKTTLTPREHEVLALLVDGMTTNAIADQLFLSRNTVRNHVQRLIAKLGAHSRLEAVALAVRRGLVDAPERDLRLN